MDRDEIEAVMKALELERAAQAPGLTRSVRLAFEEGLRAHNKRHASSLISEDARWLRRRLASDFVVRAAYQELSKDAQVAHDRANHLQQQLDVLHAVVEAQEQEAAGLRDDVARLQSILDPLQRFPFHQLRHLVDKLDWSDRTFETDKALACALVSQLAYLHVPEWELADDSRFKLVPSEMFQTIVRHRLSASWATLLRQADFDPIVVVTNDAVIVALRFHTALLVGVRGTTNLYDHFLNAQLWHRPAPDCVWGAHLHHGFSHAAMEGYERLRMEIEARGLTHLPVRYTGHSLGGAMAAIMTMLTAAELYPSMQRRDALDCYTFGMPRYANEAALLIGPQPYHLFHSKDLIPTIPPRWLGYADVDTEAASDAAGALRRGSLRNLVGVVYGWISKRGAFRHHSMELYVQDVRNLQGSNPVPAWLQAFAAR